MACHVLLPCKEGHTQVLATTGEQRVPYKLPGLRGNRALLVTTHVYAHVHTPPSHSHTHTRVREGYTQIKLSSVSSPVVMYGVFPSKRRRTHCMHAMWVNELVLTCQFSSRMFYFEILRHVISIICVSYNSTFIRCYA